MMYEYIKREDVIKHLRGACIAKYPLSFSYGIFASADEISKLPTAEVAPKSEVERWRRNLEAVLEERAETRTEVAREIFAEIDRAVEDAELEWGTIYGVKLCIAELKKKYTNQP